MSRAAALGLALALTGAAPSCAPAPALPPPAVAAAPAGAAAPFGPARYLASRSVRIERTDEGLDHVVSGGRRLVLRGAEIVRVGPAEPELDGGARAPAWAPGSAARYVFWKGRRLWGAASFLGALHPIATLPAAPSGSFDWIDGTGLTLPGGSLVAPASGAAPSGTGVPGAARALAADGRLALAITALGHARLTLDGGASYRDVSADLGGAVALAARGEGLVATLPGGRSRVVSPTGAIADAGPVRAPDRGRVPPSELDPFESLAHVRPLDAAVRAGLPLADGGVAVAAGGFVGRLDPRTLRTTSVAALDAGLRDAECTPLRAGGELLLACVGPDRAALVDLDGAPRTERTFDLAGASDLDRFVASGDDAVGYLGSCDGAPPRVPAPEVLGSGEPYNASRGRSPVFCARAGRDAWIEHRVEPAEVADVVTWIPRAGGGAVVILARPGSSMDDRDRVSVRGALRVVRLARGEPPLTLSLYGWGQREGVDRSLHALADDRVEGWLTGGSGTGPLPVTIDAGGHVRTYAAPGNLQRVTQGAGPLALLADEEGRLWETVDAGHRWVEIEPSPGVEWWANVASRCSPAGCSMGSFARLGWTGPAPAPESEPLMARPFYQRPASPPPQVRLSCVPAAAPVGRRVPDSGAMGYTPQPQPHVMLTRLTGLGVAVIPWAGGRLAASGDVELAWAAPLDLTGALRRFTVPLARLGLAPGAERVYGPVTGYLLAPDGGIDAFAVGYGERCLAPLLDLAGATRPLGACAQPGSVGVDLGGRVVVLHAGSDWLDISVAEAPLLSAKSHAFTVPVALHAVGQVTTGPRSTFTLGAGVRDGAAVVVVLDAAGAASLAPVDADRGTIGAEERLRPLAEAALGSSPACAPRPGEARVVLPFSSGAVDLDPTSLLGVTASGGAGVAVLRWSRERACLDAIELAVRDDRFDDMPGPYEPQGVLRKLVARFDAGHGGGRAALVLISPGLEIRQPLSCTGLQPPRPGAP